MKGHRDSAYDTRPPAQMLWPRIEGHHRQALFLALGSFAVAYMLMRDIPVRSGNSFLSHILPPSFPTKEAVFYSNETSYAAHMMAVSVGCGDICRIDMPGVPSLYHDYIEKEVNCRALLSNPDIDAIMGDPEPPSTIPSDMMDAFTYGGKVRFTFFDQGIFNQRYLGKKAMESVWTEGEVNEMADLCGEGLLDGTYGVPETNNLMLGLKEIDLKDAAVLVIGSERPWVEACVLSQGARKVTTLEYGAITSLHPQVHTLTPAQMRADPEHFLEAFDAVITYSSVEHSGLGRYGDALNPWGDRQAMARAWCMTKKQGRLALAVPWWENQDAIAYNAHRVYGAIQLPHLLANWKQIWRAETNYHNMVWVCEK